ncbi:radical SAM protein [Clostridium sp. 19966]|uniref:radical SAM/SPASM domain-containing protein n=1 Tax=Clostridium sp. 19966 TaxID=2768166 RepID=UPI0028DECEBE|nr:radical SAM protein [Clostridium sp. 19966]MDT8716079.1 radical SAM protein [Clostridium sp. 19966]
MNNESLLRYNINMSPTRVELELTEQCNLFCQFCYNTQKPIISTSVYQVLDKLYDEGVLEIILTGGEPMLHPEFLNILDKCSKLFTKVMVQTNGTYITEEIAGCLEKANVFGVNISLHGSKEVHEQLTCVAESYGQAMLGIKRVLNKNIKVASNFVLTSLNVSYLGDFIDELYSIGLKEMTLTRFTPTGVGASNANLTISHQQLIDALYCVKKKMDYYKDFKIILANSIPYCALPNDLKFFCEYCHFGSSRFYIDVNGNVLMCGMSRIVIGSILEKTFKEIKSDSDIYKSHVCGTDVPEKCIKCSQFSVCRGGCRAAAYACSGEICGSDPYSK